MTRVLFVCLHNAGRSQMSEALFTQATAGVGQGVSSEGDAGEDQESGAAAGHRQHEARSAGTTPGDRVHPEVVEAMRETGIDLAERTPRKLTREDAEWADVVVTMGCGDECPYIPGKRYLDWDLPDPRGRPLEEVRATREEIARRVRELLAELDG